jgi:putative ABC transport system permease protein
MVAPSLRRRLGRNAVVHTDVNLISLAEAPTVPQLDRINGGHVLIFALPEAQEVFSRQGHVDYVFVRPRHGVSPGTLARRLRRELGPQNPVLSANASNKAVRSLEAGILPLMSILGIAALAMGVALVANIINLSLLDRRRELALASALGARPAAVVTGIAIEAGAVGVIGGTVGAGFGLLVSHALVASESRSLERIAGVSLQTDVRATSVLITMALAVAAAVAAAIRPARRASGLDLAAELSERREPAAVASSRPVRATVLTILGGAGVLMTWAAQANGSIQSWQPLVGEVGIIVIVFALIAAIGSWTPVILRAVKRPLVRREGTLGIAVTRLSAADSRIAGMAVAVGTAVALGAGLSGMVPTLHKALAASYGQIIGDRVYVSTQPITNGTETDSKLTSTQVSSLAHLPGVRRVGADYSVMLNMPDSTVLVGLTSIDIPEGPIPFRTYSGSSPAAAMSSGGAMIGANLARMRHLRTGSVLTLPSPAGMVPLRVGGVWEDPNNGGIDVMVSPETIQRFWGPLPVQEVFLTPNPGVSLHDLADRVRAAHLGPDVDAQDPARFVNQFAAQVTQHIQPFWVLQRSLLILAVFATLSTLLIIGMQRRREVGLLAALGLGPGGLARMTLAEGVLVGVVASVLGICTAFALMVGFRNSAGYLFGFEPPLVTSGLASPALVYGVVALAVVLIGSGLPALRSSRLQVAEALRYE